MWIDLEDEESKPIPIDVIDNEGKLTGQQRISISTFDLYSKEVGDETENKRIITFSYEIRTTHSNATMLNPLPCKISSETANVITLIPYGLNTLKKRNYA